MSSKSLLRRFSHTELFMNKASMVRFAASRVHDIMVHSNYGGMYTFILQEIQRTVNG